MVSKNKAYLIYQKLHEAYPNSKCSLDFQTPFEMLVAVSFSAQCTDARVNIVTKDLFKKYHTPKDFAEAPLSDIEKMIHSCGFYKNKAKNLKAAGMKIQKDFNGVVPNSFDELLLIPGVGRKSANVIMLEAFDNPQGIAVDTHCKRLANRLGLSHESNPSKIEQDLLKEFPKSNWKNINHLFIDHGRAICHSKNPNCKDCVLKDICDYNL